MSFNENIKKYEEIFKEWQSIHNISKFKHIQNEVEDSIYPLKFLPPFETCLDIGSGAGFPAIFLAMIKKDALFYLSEPNKKKAGFLNFIKIKLNLENVYILNEKAQNINIKNFCLISSRAFSSCTDVLDISKKFSYKNILLYKGSFLENELQNIKKENYTIYEKDKRKYILFKGSI